MKDFIAQIEPWIGKEERIQLNRVIHSTYVTEHDLTKEFEEKIKQLTGSKYAIAMTNGTAALYCCLKSLDIGAGDEVIVPNLTFIATSNVVIWANATPVFCDVSAKTLCIDPEQIEKLITPRTKAIIPVHLYGQSADMSAILDIAKKHNLKVIEDAAQGVGVTFNDKHTGTFGDMGILSFYGNKTITCGEGGVILTDSKKLRDLSYRLKNHGRSSKGTFKHDSIGYNFAFTEMQAAIGIAQLNKLSKIIQKKQEIHDLYCKELYQLNDKFTRIELDKRCKPVWWFTSFITSEKNNIKQFLLARNIQTRDFFYPLHKQPCYEHLKIKGNFQVSEEAYANGISLPSSYSLTMEQQRYIIQSIKQFYGCLNDTIS